LPLRRAAPSAHRHSCWCCMRRTRSDDGALRSEVNQAMNRSVPRRPDIVGDRLSAPACDARAPPAAAVSSRRVANNRPAHHWHVPSPPAAPPLGQDLTCVPTDRRRACATPELMP
jgi:hypothetical protein